MDNQVYFMPIPNNQIELFKFKIYGTKSEFLSTLFESILNQWY